MNKINNTCIICGCKDFFHKYYGKDYFCNTTKKQFEIIECKNCKLEQIYPIPTKEEQMIFYPNDYYSYNKKSEINTFTSSLKKFFIKIFKNKEFELPKTINKGQNFLDIGCGDGFNLLQLKKNGSKGLLRGFEISDKIYYNNNIYYAPSITKTSFNEKYDIIWCNHVFEHIDNPCDFLDKVKDIMNDDGIFIVTLPNVKSFMSSIFKQYASERDIPRHLYGYSWNIIELFNKKGFKIINKKTMPQINSAVSFLCMIEQKHGIKIQNYPALKYFIILFFLIINFILTCIRNTNQMSFILKK